MRGMAAPAPTRETYVRRSASLCREEFSRGFQFVPCARAFTEAVSPEDVAHRLLCVALAATSEEISECEQLSAAQTFREMTAAGSLIRRRFGDRPVNGAGIVLGRAAPIIELFVPPPAPPAPPPAPPVAPPAAAPAPAVRAPAPPVVPFSSAVLRCLRGANLSATVLDALIGTSLNVEERVQPGERIDELCHQVADAAIGYVELAKFKECLCPETPPSLLQLLARSPSDLELEKLAATAGLVAAAVLPFVPP